MGILIFALLILAVLGVGELLDWEQDKVHAEHHEGRWPHTFHPEAEDEVDALNRAIYEHEGQGRM